MTRVYYDDPIKNERFKRIYEKRMYCPHGTHNFIPCCFCRNEARERQYQAYRSEHRENGFTAFNDNFDEETRSFDSEDDYDTVEFCVLRKSESFEDLKKEYHNLAKIHHPDKGGNTEIFQRLSNLYDELRSVFF